MDYSKPKVVTGAELAFGPKKLSDVLPPMSEIPDEFKKSKTQWNDVISRWFYSGLSKETQFIPKDGMSQEDFDNALNQIKCILCSFKPKQEHKEAGTAYLLSLWFKDVILLDRGV